MFNLEDTLLETRLETLEIKIAYQEDTIIHLNEVITRMQLDMLAMKKILEVHEQRWERFMPLLQNASQN